MGGLSSFGMMGFEIHLHTGPWEAGDLKLRLKGWAECKDLGSGLGAEASDRRLAYCVVSLWVQTPAQPK